MLDRVELETDCPNNHNQTVTFSKSEFEASLKSDSLVFHCNTCDTDWTPSKADLANFRNAFSNDSN
jgi:hypothetical protein